VELAFPAEHLTDTNKNPTAYCLTAHTAVYKSRNQFGDHCFATAGPTLWNSLPEQL